MRLFLLLLLLCTCSFGLGHTSVTTLEFPYGSENTGLGESGAAFSNSLSSSFFNPANGALYGKRETVNVAFDGFFEMLLPALGLGDLWHGAASIGAFAPDAQEDWSFGYVYTMNLLYFGEISELVESDLHKEQSWYEYDENGDSVLVWGYMAKDTAYEMVHSHTFSAAYKNIVSIGLGYAHYKSVLSKRAKDRGAVLNVGLRAQKEFDGLNNSYLIPGIGVALNGINKDSTDYNKKDSVPGNPTPHVLNVGLSVEGGRRDHIYGVVLFDVRREMTKNQKGELDKPIFSPGFQIGITPFFKFNNGALIDKDGQRFEYHWGSTMGFQQIRVRNYLSRRFGYTPINSKKNVQVLYSFSVIAAFGDNTVRSRQFCQTLSFAMGFGKKRKTDDLVERDELPLWEE